MWYTKIITDFKRNKTAWFNACVDAVMTTVRHKKGKYHKMTTQLQLLSNKSYITVLKPALIPKKKRKIFTNT